MPCASCRDERSAAMRALDNMDPETLKRILSDVRSSDVAEML